jgi:hypothetical protein
MDLHTERRNILLKTAHKDVANAYTTAHDENTLALTDANLCAV